MAMSNMLKMITEIDQTAGGIMEEIGKCKDTAFERKKDLEEEKQRDFLDLFVDLPPLQDRICEALSFRDLHPWQLLSEQSEVLL
ncbi:hypothetical protein SADUNF_Sadunf06G0196400 [Salix dunnii]|uniref:Uncharacterized protein n=1 Tax=Salix dunnii TaxID=1413687 RepID=A0A835MW66_9ROSI|nr:hypothetical protein SADUNF_Sadunf06G0196400 [Salix dunnii]